MLKRASEVVGRSLVGGWLAEIGSLACLYIIKVYVGIRRNSIFTSCLLAASIGNALAVRTPAQLLNTAKRFHRAFEWFVAQHRNRVGGEFGAIEMIDKWLRNGFHPLVPMAVHRFIHHIPRCLRQVGWLCGNGTRVRHGVDDEHKFLVGREDVVLDVAFSLRNLLSCRTVGIHHPELHRAVGICSKESDFSVLQVFWSQFTTFLCGEQFFVGTISVERINHGVALVFSHAVIAHVVGNLFGIGRNRRTANASHRPKQFGSQCAILNFGRLSSNKGLSLRFFLCHR